MDNKYDCISIDVELDTLSLIFCNEYSISITNKHFLKSIVSSYKGDTIFNLKNISSAKLKIGLLDFNDKEYNTIIKLYYNNIFMGYASLQDMATSCSLLLEKLDEIKNESN